jgi:tetratricopeptide (TPR) repeat protein
MFKYIFFCFLIGASAFFAPLCAQKADMAITFNAIVNAINSRQITNQNGLIQLDSFLIQYPKFGKGYAYRGKLYAEMNQFEIGLRDCNKAIDLDSTLQESYEYRGRIYLNLNQYSNAIQDFTTSLKIHPFAETYNVRGRTYLETNVDTNLAYAIQDFKEALRLNQKLEAACVNLKKACERCNSKSIIACEACHFSEKISGNEAKTSEICCLNKIVRLEPMESFQETDVACLKILFKLKTGSPKRVQIQVNNQVVQPCMKSEVSSPIAYETTIPLQVGRNQIEMTIIDEDNHQILQYFIINRVEKRIALLIGNRDYLKYPLTNPINDIDSMEKVLIQKKFEVLKAINVRNQTAFEVEIEQFIKQGADKNVLLFFFAGHGHEMNMIPYMEGTMDEGKEGFSIEILFNKLRRMQSKDKSKLFILIIDACRSHPSRDKIVELESLMPENMIVAFGTFSGERAFDQCGQNGCYTKALLKAIQTPHLSLNDVFNKARELVENDTKKWQTSVEKNRLKGRIFIF